MRKGFKGILLIPFFILIGTYLQAQVTSVSPYSKIGLGDLNSNSYTAAQGFGGANLGLFDKININFANPASYSALELTTFEVGFQGTSYEQKQLNPDISAQNGSAGLRYFVFGLPVKDWWGAAFGIQPYSLKGYNISSTSSIGGFGYETQTEGSGGLNQLFFGNSFEVAKGLSLGINTSFVFGKIEESQYVIFDNSNFLNTKIQEVANIKGVYFSFGGQYQHDLGNDRELGVGFTYSNAMDLNADIGNFSYTFLGQPGAESPIDSTASSSSVEGNIKLPSEIGFGLSYVKRKNTLENGGNAWGVNTDIHLYNGEEYSNYDGTNFNLVNGYKVEVGGFFIPNVTIKALDKKRARWSRTQIRLGGFYEKTPYLVHGTNSPNGLNGTNIMNYGITFGLGIPFEGSKYPGEVKVNTVNTGIILGRRGTTDNGLIQESYLSFYLGITLNDKWFIKQKYR